MLSVCEHGRIFLGDVNQSLPDGNLQLKEHDFRSLLTLLGEDSDDEIDYSPVFTYLRPKGREQLKVQKYVGVIRLADGVQIEVLPKISKLMDPLSARELLVRMLIELEESPFFEGNAADLEAHRMPIFELLMRCFLDHVAAIIRKGIARTYVSQQDNLVFLRGKLRLAEHLRRNSYNATRFACEFDEYEVNRPINRLIKGALEVVHKLARQPGNQQRCRELLFWFDAVPASTSYPLDYQRVQRDRFVQHYAPAMPLCKLILESLNPLTQQGESQVVSMLFPMERVFEAYVATRLSRQLRGWWLETQFSGEALVEQHLGRRMFRLRPDLMFSKGSHRIIADTKWKLIDENGRSENYRISQSDIYQLFAYSRKFLRNQSHREVLLVYPASDTFTQPLEPFWYRQNADVLYVVPFDLQRDTLLLPDASLLREDKPLMAVS